MIVNKEQLKPYLDMGLDLIPLYPWNKQTRDKKGVVREKGKIPIYKDWTKQEISNEKTLERAGKGFNIGYRINSGFLVIDVDPRNYIDNGDSLVSLGDFLGIEDLSGYFPTVLTGGGGYHFYCTIAEGTYLRETIEDWPGIEFKTKGRQVVAAGSKHPSGKYYEWDEWSPELCDIPQCPDKLIEKLKREIPKVQPGAGVINCEELHHLLVQLPVVDYSDHNQWFKIMCASHHGTGGQGIEEFLHWSLQDEEYASDEHIIRQRWDSLSEKQLNITVNSLYKDVLAYGGRTTFDEADKDFADFADDPNGNKGIDSDFDDLLVSPDVDPSYKPGLALDLAHALVDTSSDEEIIQAIRAALQSGTIEQVKAFKILQQNLNITKGELNDIVKHIKEKVAADIGRALAEKTIEKAFYGGKGLVFNYNSQFWSYNGKFWEPITKEYVGKKVTEVLDKMREKIDIGLKENALVSEAVSIISRLAAVKDDALRLNKKPYPVINCTNGELWVKDGMPKIKAHRPQSYLTQIIGVEYSPGAECPIFDAAIRRTFGAFEDCEDMVRHFEEFMGYTLHPEKRPAHWWLLKGPGGDGKTTLLKILSALLGNSVQPDDLTKYKSDGDNHALYRLVGKLLLYDDDLNANTVLPDGVLKKLSEDGEITANPKGVAAFTFTKVCTVALLSNGFPKTKDMSRGFRRRAMVIPFNNAFHKEGGIVDLVDQIVNSELAGVLNRALEGLERIKKRGEFLEPKSCKIAKQAFLHESNTVALYADEKIGRTGVAADVISLSDLYASYNDFCISYGVNKVDTKQKFRSTLEDMDFQFNIGAKNKRIFRGIKFKEIPSEDFDFEEDFEDF